MLGKLIKYDIKDLFKSMFPIYLVLLILSVFIRLDNLLAQKIEIFKGVQIFMIFTFCVIAIISIGYCFLISIMNFYKKVLKDEGYLTNTLPVRKNSILTSKILVSTIILIISVIVIILCCMIAFYSKGMIKGIWQQIELLFSQINCNIYLFLGIGTIFLLISYAGAISMIYCALAVGHSFNKNKLAYSVVAGIILYFIYQALSIMSMLALIFTNIDVFNTVENDIILAMDVIGKIFTVSIINMIVIFITTYVTTNYQLNNRLNLD